MSRLPALSSVTIYSSLTPAVPLSATRWTYAQVQSRRLWQILAVMRTISQFFFIYLFLPLHTGSCCPIYGRAPAPPQGYRRCAGAYPTPVYHSWRTHSEDRETLGIEPGTSRSPDERSTNWANRPASLDTVSGRSAVFIVRFKDINIYRRPQQTLEPPCGVEIVWNWKTANELSSWATKGILSSPRAFRPFLAF